MNQQPTEQDTTLKTEQIPQDRSLKSTIDVKELHKVSLQYTFTKKIQEISCSKRNKISTIDFHYIEDKPIIDWSLQQSKALSLHKWQRERAVSLWFHKNHQMEDAALKWVMRLLKMNFSNLTRLDITFVDCYSVTWKGIEFLSEIARHLPKLQELNLHFCGVVGLTSEGAKSLESGLIKHLQNIESFSLGLEDRNGLEDQDVELLLSSISRYMHKLKCFDLSFNYSETVTNATVDLVAQVISKKFKHLHTFELSLISCENIDYENLDQISQTLSWIPDFTLRTEWR